MNVLVVGSGAREHALAWKIAASPRLKQLFLAPGNVGMQALGTCLDVRADDVRGLVQAAVDKKIDFVVIGPEVPLVLGLVDELRAQGILAFGPSKKAAQLEGSKAFAKHFMSRHGIVTADFLVADTPARAMEHVRRLGRACVVKADGLASGKGVVVAANVAEAEQAIERIMVKQEFGPAGAKVVIEECLIGQEVSYHVVSDGQRYVALAAAQDHKRLLDGDQGPNTGGMGAYSPPSIVTPAVEEKILRRIVEPTLQGMRDEEMPFQGALFVGVMICEVEPYVLEYNVRFGDPETEVLMMRYAGDMLQLLVAAAEGDVSGVTPKWGAPAALCVVLAAAGYPENPHYGANIQGLDHVSSSNALQVFHAGTQRVGERLQTAGGRVLTVSAAADRLENARTLAYQTVDSIHFAGMLYRKDIAHHALD